MKQNGYYELFTTNGNPVTHLRIVHNQNHTLFMWTARGWLVKQEQAQKIWKSFLKRLTKARRISALDRWENQSKCDEVIKLTLSDITLS